VFLKQSTASQTRLTPRFVDDTDFKTPETGLTIANTDVKLSKNGAASANKNSGGGTHIEAGRYALTFDATDTATVGELAVGIVISGALPVEFKYFVVEEAVYDGLFAASAAGYLQSTTAGRTLDVSAGGEAGVDWANVGSPTTSLALTGTTIATTQKVDIETIKTNPVVNGGTITFPTTATLASTTNITAGTIATVTNLTNAPTAGDFTATMKTSIGTAVAASAVASIGTGGISAGSFAAGAIDAAAIAANAIGSSELAAGAITAAKFAAGAIDAAALAADAVDEILDDTIGDGTITVRQALRVILAACAGKLSGAATTTATIRNLADSANVVVATVDADGNRTAVTVTP
jgi:hypothetical protein